MSSKDSRQDGCHLTPAQICSVFAVVLLTVFSGCTRASYRLRADQEAYNIIAEKAQHPRWSMPDYSVVPDSQSRMFDPYNPDRPPMPQDDPVAHQYMHWVDQKKGYAYWHANGDTPYAENPTWREYLPLDERGVLKLDGSTAVQLAILHSPNYQQQIETLYLSALDVSAERFRFDTQFFGGYGIDYRAIGRNAPGSGGESRSILDLSTRDVRATRFFTTGAELTVGLANSLMWQFSGPDTHSAFTLLDFTLVQPLLRNAGRDRVMETLTLSERTLLGNVRQFQHYRLGFYMNLMTGDGRQQGPTRRGGFFGASGLGGFTGVGGGGFGGVGGAAFGFGGNQGQAITGGGAGAGFAGGFYGLLQAQQSIRNQEASIASLQSSLAQLEAFGEAGRIDFFQVEQVRQQVYQSLSQLLTQKRAYQDALDEFKEDIGLPPQVPVQIEDTLLDRFKLIDTAIVPIQNHITELQYDVGQIILELLPNGDGAPMWSDEVRQRLESLSEYVDGIDAARMQVIERNLPRVQADIDELRRSYSDRAESAERLRQIARREEHENLLTEERLFGDVDESLFDVRGLRQLPDSLQGNLQDILERFEQDANRSAQVKADIQDLLQRGPELDDATLFATLRERVFAPLPSLLTEMAADVLELSLIQARARAESVVLVPVELDSDLAIEIARVARLDWMNARASLVDSWRLIEFNADSLEGFLDVVFSGDIRNTGDNPIRLRSSAGSLRVGLQFDAPLTRLQERNNYRQSLIEYQQSRRRYYQLEDSIAQQLRAILRQINLNKVNFELRRTALRVAVAQVQSARLQLEEPPRPQTELGTASATFGPTIAQNLLSALNGLRGAQDDFLSVWVNYEVQRGLLDLNLGTMQLDDQGLWIDPGAIGPEFNYPDLKALGLDCYLEPVETIEPGQPSRLEPSEPADSAPADQAEIQVQNKPVLDSPDQVESQVRNKPVLDSVEAEPLVLDPPDR